MKRVGIVGGGIVGLAVARELLRTRPGLDVVVHERESSVAAHQTGHNSGVVHAGIYYRPGSLKAELCTRGRGLLREFCAEHQVVYDEVGKLVVAVDDAELGRFDALERSATTNAVPGLRRLDHSALREVEPHARGRAALHSPHTAITDYRKVCDALVDDIVGAGGTVRTGTAVTAIRRRVGGVALAIGGCPDVFDHVVVCGGLQVDRLAQQADGRRGPRIVPFRGEYMTVRSDKRDLVRGMIYPVPDPRYPFLGVHFTRRADGGLDVGPNALLGLSRDDYRPFRATPRDVADYLRWPGFWRMARTHWLTGARELYGSLSPGAYMRGASRYVPEITFADVERGPVGIRAQAVGRDGSLVDDFVITSQDGVTCVRNAPSPAATSSLAIAEHIVAGL